MFSVLCSFCQCISQAKRYVVSKTPFVIGIFRIFHRRLVLLSSLEYFIIVVDISKLAISVMIVLYIKHSTLLGDFKDDSIHSVSKCCVYFEIMPFRLEIVFCKHMWSQSVPNCMILEDQVILPGSTILHAFCFIRNLPQGLVLEGPYVWTSNDQIVVL